MQLLREEPQRMALEKRLLEELARKEAWFRLDGWDSTNTGNLCVHFGLQMTGGAFLEGTLVYPHQFPDVPAFIRPRNPRARWSNHQYGRGGVLCLERGPDNWHRGVTGVELIHSARKLVWSELINGLVPGATEIPSRHETTRGGVLRFEPRRFVVTKGLRALVERLPADAVASMTVSTTFLANMSVSVATTLGVEPAEVVADAPRFDTGAAFEQDGWLVRLKSGVLSQQVESLVQLQTLVGDKWPLPEPLPAQVKVLAICDERHLRVFKLSGESPPTFTELAVIDASQDSEHRQPSSFNVLPSKSVLLVGLGSLGSKVALSLARSGVGKFFLLDEDVLMPENLVRHGLTWTSVGYDKVDGVANDIKLVAPGAEVAASSFSVGGQENPSFAAGLGDTLAAFDLVVDATASPEAFVTLAAGCRRAKVSMVWAELFGGGIGALMARSRPGRDATPLSVRSHIAGVLGTMSPVPEHARTKRNNYEQGQGDRVLVASDADVTTLAGMLAQFSLDTLCTDNPSEYPVSAYLIGFRKAWEFTQPFDVRPIDCSGALSNEEPNGSLTDEEEKAVATMLAAFQSSSNAPNHSAP